MKTAAPQSIDFDVIPEIGTVVMFHGQRYEMVVARSYTRRDGSETTLIIWSTHCARCGDPMEVSTTLKSAVNRRCPECAQKGVRV